MAERETVVVQTSKSDAAAMAAVVTAAVQELGGIVKELEKVAISSPLVSISLSIIVADVLHNAKVISDGAYLSIMALTITAGGVSLANDISSLLQSVNPVTGIFKSASPPANLLSNSVQTLVTVQGQDNPQLNALLGQLASK